MGLCRTPAQIAARWREAGIPDGYTISQLLYNPSAEVIVIQLRGMKDASLCERLLMRDRGAHRYELIGNPDPDVAFKYPVTCEKLPVLVFNSMRYRRDPDGSRRGADWDGLYSFNFQSGELNITLSCNDPVLPSPYDDRGWFARFLAFQMMRGSHM